MSTQFFFLCEDKRQQQKVGGTSSWNVEVQQSSVCYNKSIHCLLFSRPQEERRSQAGLLLARADNANDINSSETIAQATPVNTDNNATSNSSGQVRGGPAKENNPQTGEGGGARQAQLASLLCKAEQYSMFIRQSQV